MYLEDKVLGPKTTYSYDLNGLIAWLETKPAEGAYQFNSTAGNCLIGQFFTAIGKSWNGWDYVTFLSNNGAWMKHDSPSLPAEHPWTYGAALERARSLRDTGSY